ncbi:MAG: hypothetical protein JWQ27_1493 [Ferruginibacter sp.]|nr:hypothetical protein [Ferruginibacter sp.]
MKKTLRRLWAPLCIVMFLLAGNLAKAQQTLTQINGWNAYVHLPASYSSTSTNYPTIIFFPGIGEIGTTASRVISNGPGAYIAQGWNGNVVVDGSTVEFIVISLQPPTGYPSEFAMNQRLQTIKSSYRVDLNRIYLTGLSHGGWCGTTFVTGDPYGGPYTYASQIAAVVTVEGVIPDDNSPYPNLFDNYAAVGGKYLGFEQALDGRDTKRVVDRMNAAKPNSAIHVLTNFGGGGHCCWSSFYGGGGAQPGIFNLGGVSQNLYQWLARQSMSGVTLPPPNVLPTANAGPDKTITLPVNSTTLDGSGTDSDGTVTGYAWTQVSGPSTGLIANSTYAQTAVSNLVAGTYTYRLTVTDNSGGTKADDMQITVNPALVVNILPTVNAGQDKTITLPVSIVSLDGSATDSDGTISSYSWTKISGPAAGVITNPAIAQTSVSSLVAGTYTYRLTVVDNSGGSKYDDMQVTVNPATLVNQAPTANPGADKNITLPTNYSSLDGSGADPDGNISAYAWTQVSGPSPATISNPDYPETSAGNLLPGTYVFKLTVTDNAGATGSGNMQIVVNGGAPVNQLPIVSAGPNTSITLPVNSITLNGNASDPDGTIVSYLWAKLLGPAGGTIVNPTAASTSITGLAQGVYKFTLTAKDNSGASSVAQVQITVNAAAQQGGTTTCNTAAPKVYMLTQTGPGEIYRPNGSLWKGGDTIKITGTNYSVIEFYNVGGDACRPLVIMPLTTVSTPVFRIKGKSHHIKIWGGTTQYGLKVVGGPIAITMADHIEINNVEASGGSTGVYCKQDPDYNDPTTWAASGYIMSNMKFTNLWIHDIDGEGMYVGITQPDGVPRTKPNGQDTMIVPIRLDSVEISNCLVERTNWDGIQLSNARAGNKIFNNTVRNYGMINMSSQEAGIILGSNTTGDIYGNTVFKGPGNGIEAFGYGVINVYNNTLDSCGYDGTANGQQTIYASDFLITTDNNPKQTMNVYGNAVNHPKTAGGIFIAGYYFNSFPSSVYNNTFCIPGATSNWLNTYLKSYVAGSTSSNNILSCGGATTIAPIANAGAAQSITLPVSAVTLSGSGTDADGTVVSYQWVKASGPAGGAIANAATASTQVSGLQQGVYVFELTVTDNTGLTGKATVQITVNGASNSIPTANAGSAQTITLPTSAVSLTGTGTDTDGTITAYLWTKISGPSAGTITTATAAGTTVTGLVAGVYNFQLQVTDNAGATATATTQVTVNAATVTTTGKAIRVNIYGGSNGYSDVKWNNWNVAANVTSATFLYEDRTPSTVKALLSGDNRIVDNGSNYASSATVQPGNVLRYNSANTSMRTVTLTGLTPGKVYNLEFYASRASTGNKTEYAIGNLKDTISTDNNINDYANFKGISPDASGKIEVVMNRIGVWNYIAGFSIIEQPATAGRSMTTETTPEIVAQPQVYKGETIFESGTNSVSVYPNPFVGSFKVQVNNKLSGEYALIISNTAGQRVFYKRVVKPEGSIVEDINVSSLPGGTYILQIVHVATGTKTIHKLIKN